MASFFKKKLAYIFKLNIICTPFLFILTCGAEEASYVLGSWKYLKNDNLSAHVLDKASGFEKGSLINDIKIQEVLRNIKSLYQEKGYYFAEIEVSKNFDASGRLDLQYEINEGKRVEIGEIKFSGNSAVPSKLLQQEIKSGRKALLRKAFFDERQLEEDRKSLDGYYKKNGIEGRVADMIRNFSSDGTRVDIVFLIQEGGLKNDEMKIDEIGSKPTDELMAVSKSTNQKEESIPEMKNESGENKQIEAAKIPPPETVKPSIASAKSITDLKKPVERPDQETATGTEPVVDSTENKEKAVSTEKSLGNAGETKAEKRVAQLEAELKNLSDLLKDRQDVENLLSGMLTAEKADKRRLEGQVEELKTKVRVLEGSLESSRAEEKKLRNELEERKSKEKEILGRNDNAEKKLEAINSLISLKLKEIEKIKDNLNTILTDTRSAIEKELDRVELSEVTVADTTKEVKPEIVKETVKPSDEKKATEKTLIQAKVVVVNGDMNFFVCNAGVDAGVYKGMKFEIRRQGRSIAVGKVMEVRKKISASDIIEKKEPVQTGDEVIELVS